MNLRRAPLSARSLLLAWPLLWLFATSRTASAQIPPIPPEYQDLYDNTVSQINIFSNTVNANWNHSPYPVTYSAQLVSAASELGPQLLDSGHYTSVLLELDSLKALGVRAVTLHIDFPALYPAYQPDYLNYLSFYLRLSSDIRNRGLKLIVESQLQYSMPGLPDVDCMAFYNSLTEQQYIAGRAQVAALIAQQIKPDYLSVILEPDSEAKYSGKPAFGTVAGSTTLLNAILAGIAQAGATQVSVGAGVGTWLPNYQQFIQSYAATGIQYVDMHIYPINQDFLLRALSIADMAAAAGKQLSVSEAWPYKVRDSELSVFESATIIARDPFSFWAPVDGQFLRALVDFSQYKHVAFISPFWSTYFHAYVAYDATTAVMGPDQLLTQASTQASSQMLAGQYTSTGLAWAAAITIPADTLPPGAPSGLTAQGVSTSQINVTWAPATDNTGVAGYGVYRDGILVATTALTGYQDGGLGEATTHYYTIVAYDAAGNRSAPSGLVSTSTIDATAPSVPGGVVVRAASATQVNVSWAPSQDNGTIAGYGLYRGTTASSLALIAGATTNSFVDVRVAPSTTYYYAVAAKDSYGNTSGRSVPVLVTTPPDTTPPSTPTGLTAAAAAGSIQLSWTPSTDNYAVAGYGIYGGISPTSMKLIAGSATTSYSDAACPPAATCYYAVAAFDPARNVSNLSTAVSARMTGADTQPPASPSGLTATAASGSTQLVWLASQDNVQVAGYKIYRGSAPNGLQQIAITNATSYTDIKCSWKMCYYAVAAYDTADNTSPLSNTASIARTR